MQRPASIVAPGGIAAPGVIVALSGTRGPASPTLGSVNGAPPARPPHSPSRAPESSVGTAPRRRPHPGRHHRPPHQSRTVGAGIAQAHVVVKDPVDNDGHPMDVVDMVGGRDKPLAQETAAGTHMGEAQVHDTSVRYTAGAIARGPRGGRWRFTQRLPGVHVKAIGTSGQSRPTDHWGHPTLY